MKKFLLSLVFLFTMVAGVFVYTSAYAGCSSHPSPSRCLLNSPVGGDGYHCVENTGYTNNCTVDSGGNSGGGGWTSIDWF